MTDEDRVALVAFEDELIDRLYVLNAERAVREARFGLHAKKGKEVAAKKSTRTNAYKATSVDAMTLPGLDDEADP